MTALCRNIVWIGGLALFALLPSGAHAQAPLERAQTLYTSARFTDALAVLTSIQPATRAETVATAKTRALCLLALGRAEEAEKAFETLVETDPGARLTDADAAPRVRALFAEVRGRVLPSLVRERFAEAKELFTEGKRVEAATAFHELRALINDPDLAKAGATGFSDLRVLVDGFLELTDSEEPIDVAAKPAPSAATPANATNSATNRDGAPTPSDEITADTPPETPDTAAVPERSRTIPPTIVPPVVVSQQIPQPRGVPSNRQSAKLVLEVLINEQGRVDRATLQQSSLHPVYDAMLLAAAERWEYKPATRDGRPVKFLKTIEVTVHP